MERRRRKGQRDATAWAVRAGIYRSQAEHLARDLRTVCHDAEMHATRMLGELYALAHMAYDRAEAALARDRRAA